MGLFSRNTQDLTGLYQAIMQLTTEMHNLKGRLDALETSVSSLRGVINRKLGKGVLKEEEAQEEPITAQDLQRALLGMPNGKE